MAHADSNSNRSRILQVGLAWIVITALAELAALAISWQPFGNSREARISDEAFELLVYMSVPVMTFVLIMGGFSVLVDRDKGDDLDGAPVRTNSLFIGGWMVITTVLAVVAIITPGFSGLDELAAEPNPDLIIDVRGERWNWTYSYPESGVETQGVLMIPVDTRIMFRITSTDVIHSFWIPAFRIKQDAVPGQVTSTMVTAEEIGSFGDADELRVQCAEMCGVGHARMSTGVDVVSEAEFAAWIEARK